MLLAPTDDIMFFLPTDNTKNTKFLFGQQITQITQKIKFVLFVSSVGTRNKSGSSGSSGDKEKISCYSCHPLAKEKKPYYPHGQQSLVKIKFAIYH